MTLLSLLKNKSILACFCRIFFFLIFILVNGTIGFSQSLKQINGRVTDELSKPLEGVSVSIKNENTGTVTNKNGEYKISCKENSFLIFSLLGFETKEIQVGQNVTLNTILHAKNSELDEVVVIGYGVQKKTDLTGSVSTIKGSVLTNRPINNVAEALQGTAPGLAVTRTSGQPGSEGIKIQIRGVTSVNGAVDPLLVIDGIVTPLSALQTLNANDIENINILKDASSTAIYGAQGAGGVILVTTKNDGSGKLSFEYSNLMGAKWALNSKPERLSLLDEALYSNLAKGNAGQAPEYTDYDLDNIRKGLTIAPNPNAPGKFVYYAEAGEKIPLVLRDNNFTQMHNMSVKGGLTDKFHYLFSAGYNDETGVFKVGPDGLKRYNFRFNEVNKIAKNLTFEARLAYTLEKIEAPTLPADGTSGLFFQMFRYRQLYPIWTETGKLNGYGTGDYSYAHLTEGGFNRLNNNYFTGTFKLKYDDFLINGLQLSLIYGGWYKISDQNKFNRKITLYWSDDPIRFFNNPNSYQVINNTSQNNNLQVLANYSKKIKDHDFNFLVGYQWQDSHIKSLFSEATNLATNDLPTLNLGPRTGRNTTEIINEDAYLSLFGRMNYNYKNKILFQFSLREDQSSRLAPEYRSNLFPSVALGLNLNNERWFNNAFPFISLFKPRVSWGKSGSSIGIGNYDYFNLITTANNLVLGDPQVPSVYFYQQKVPSSTLTWETISSSNLGFDIGLLGNRILTNIDFYNKKNDNMLTPINLPATFGVGTPLVNMGKLKTWGWEVNLTYRNRDNNALQYSIGFNLSNSKNELIKYDGRQVILPGFNNVIEGFPINSLWGYKTDGYFQNSGEVSSWAFQNQLTAAGDVKYLDLNRDNKIDGGKGSVEDHGDLVFLGTVQPQYLFGILGNLAVKNFDVSFFIQGVAKRKFYPNQNAVQPMPSAPVQPLKFQMDYWTPENPNAVFPRPYLGDNFNYLPSDRRILDGKYIRLKNIQLGYSLPDKLIKKVNIQRVRVFFSAQDLITFSRLGVYKHLLDPEAIDTNATGTEYPYFATAAFGLNINF